MAGKGEVITDWQNKLRAAIAHVVPADTLAEMHRVWLSRGDSQPPVSGKALAPALPLWWLAGLTGE